MPAQVELYFDIFFSVQVELRTETQKTVELIDTLEQQSQHRYHAEPPINMPYIPPNINLAQKSGYLLHRSYVYIFSYL